jgi:hypothetical protein
MKPFLLSSNPFLVAGPCAEFPKTLEMQNLHIYGLKANKGIAIFLKYCYLFVIKEAPLPSPTPPYKKVSAWRTI